MLTKNTTFLSYMPLIVQDVNFLCLLLYTIQNFCFSKLFKKNRVFQILINLILAPLLLFNVLTLLIFNFRLKELNNYLKLLLYINQ